PSRSQLSIASGCATGSDTSRPVGLPRLPGVRVTVAIPAYDEVTSLGAVVAEGIAELAAIGLTDDGEVLIVDDGSTDGTSALADELVSSTPNVRVVHHGRNRGVSGAMRPCFRESRGDWISLPPADGPSSAADLFRAHSRGAVTVTVVVPHFPRRSGRAKGGRLSVVLVTLVELVRIAVLVRIDEMRRVGRVET